MTLLGNFSDDAFEEYQRLISEEQEIDFSEGDVYDFTRCVRADGSAYGTGGKCRQGSESAKEPKPSGKTRPKAAIESDMRKLTSSGAMQQRGLAGVKARAEHASLKAELNKSAQTKEEAPKGRRGDLPTAADKKSALDAIRNEAAKRAAAGDEKGVDAAIKAYARLAKAQTEEESTPKRSQVDLVTPQKQGQADVDRMKKYLKDESDKLKNLNDAQKQNPSRSNDPDVVSRKKVLERNIAAVEKQLKAQTEEGASKGSSGINLAKVQAAKAKLAADKKANGGKRLDRIQEEQRLERNRIQRENDKKINKSAPYRVSQEDVDRTIKIIDGEKQKLQNLNDSVKKNPELGKDPEVQKQRKSLEATVKSYYEALVYIMDRQAAENKQAK